MNRYLLKIAAVIGAKLGMPAGQPVPAQTLQVMKQVGDPSMKREATGTLNLKSKGGFNHPRHDSVLPQKMPMIKGAKEKEKHYGKAGLAGIIGGSSLHASSGQLKEAKIEIKKSHKGLLHKDLGEKPGKKLSVGEEEKAKHSSNPAERKRATFALNARKWNKK